MASDDAAGKGEVDSPDGLRSSDVCLTRCRAIEVALVPAGHAKCAWPAFDLRSGTSDGPLLSLKA